MVELYFELREKTSLLLYYAKGTTMGKASAWEKTGD